ncbi:flagellar hook-basal body complex protein FliE [Paenibacillus daejeonensis]|uniref:flagellar hook-basal body complex protein FliE n=1 Tax=Paenibacillus daejeonensis TaxID=135193 RepID=UPI000362CA0D|nr:flagellar hook-basal body complex protein FliE [Paenibacillus daejeonensis]
MIGNQLLNPIQSGTVQPQILQSKATPAQTTQDFGQYLKQAIDGVAAQEKGVHTVTDQFIIGQADVSDVMVVANQAHLTLQLTSQVRNKVIEAYQEMMRIQL